MSNPLTRFASDVCRAVANFGEERAQSRFLREYPEYEYAARTYEMNTLELVGAILARAQLIESIMRRYIADLSGEHPSDANGTFGQLKERFKGLYPDETDLHESLDIANEVRNDAAHTDFLGIWTVLDVDLRMRSRDRVSTNGPAGSSMSTPHSS